MKQTILLTFFSLCLLLLAHAQHFTPEKLIGRWKAVFRNSVQMYDFVDATHLNIYDSKGVKSGDSPLLYHLENITATGFKMTTAINGDTDKSHASAVKCQWISDNQFTLVPAQAFPGDPIKIVLTRKK